MSETSPGVQVVLRKHTHHRRVSKFRKFMRRHRLAVYGVAFTLAGMGVGGAMMPKDTVFQCVSSYQDIRIPMHMEVREGHTTRVLKGITVTAYTNDPAETSPTPDITYTGFPVSTGILAVSHDLWNHTVFPGDIVCIHKPDTALTALVGKQQCFEARDLMNKRWTRRLDVFTYNKSMSSSFRIESSVTVVHAGI